MGRCRLGVGICRLVLRLLHGTSKGNQGRDRGDIRMGGGGVLGWGEEGDS